ncbi:MAG: DUF1570 domain-containing protein [Pirellulaceae bacterium]|nr:DUF1570 domain-containing protein [Pirellulaceae bacterium]
MRSSSVCCAIFLVGVGLSSVVSATRPGVAWGTGPTVEFDLHGQTLAATPIAWNENRVLMLGRDGYLWDMSPQEASNYQKTADDFSAFSQAEMRGMLLREFGEPFEVSGTGNYLVVHAAGQRDRWAPGFEKVYRSFQEHFSVRGRSLRPLEFPLVAIVFATQKDFLDYGMKNQFPWTSETLGFYALTTNRIYLYNNSPLHQDDSSWLDSADAIIHECAHQLAFNTGLHSRTASPPLWVVEGLGTMFEAPGLWNARFNRSLKDRVNRQRWLSFQQFVATSRPSRSLRAFLGSDVMFSQDRNAAYAEAWALTFFLSEKEPRGYAKLLALTANKPSFRKNSASERLADFKSIFGENLELLEARYLRFIAGLH